VYEINIALKYLVPRARALSVSIISVISTLVIAAVVWLTIVFFSATEGLERRWTEKLITITAPIRVTPTDSYFQSYYSQIDALAEQSNFTSKSIREKLLSGVRNPYNKDVDPELPANFAKPLLDDSGNLIDLVKEAKKSILDIPTKTTVTIFETAFANVRMQVTRQNPLVPGEFITTTFSQASYLLNFDSEKNGFESILLPPTSRDLEHLKEITRDENPTLYTVHQENGKWILPTSPSLGEGVLLPKSFRDSSPGVLIGDKGYFSYSAPTATAMQEQRMPFYVAGFYDPGIIPIGGKLILVNENIVSTIQAASLAFDGQFPTGFNVNFTDYKRAPEIKREIIENLQRSHIDSFFKVESYDEYEFTRDLFQQLKSERNLFSLIALIIVIVACSNIISMLIILVHDKQKEIAILRALGASKKSIGFIFGLSGFLMGATGSIIGAGAACLTVQNLPALLQLLGRMQGFDVLNASFYGEMMPTEVSSYAFLLVTLSTAAVSTAAGLAAAYKASRQNTSDALRSE